MKTQTEVERLTIKMNFSSSLEPHKGSNTFPNRRRPAILAITWKRINHVREGLPNLIGTD
jgi:hypothetical protein